MLKDLRIGVIGAGVMGAALLDGLLSAGVERDHLWATVRTEGSRAKAERKMGLTVGTDYVAQLPGTDLLLLCVKPRGVREVCRAIRSAGTLPESCVVVSIAAGVDLEQIERELGQPNPVVRAMPNTPCQVHAGMTVLCRGRHATAEHIALAQAAFENVGRCLELAEHYMDAVTGLSASGPAFIYLIVEALADGGVKVGLPRDVALDLVVQCVLGAATMIRVSGRHPAALKDEVTTPAGCTIGAVMTLEDGKIRSVLARAVEEASRIAAELGR